MELIANRKSVSAGWGGIKAAAEKQAEVAKEQAELEAKQKAVEDAHKAAA